MNRWWDDKRFGDIDSPTYVYNQAIIREQAFLVRKEMNDITLLYALKANSHPIILDQMKNEELIDGVDVASLGELRKALRAGFPPGSISVTGPSKPLRFLKECLSVQVGTICVESIVEMERICTLGGMQSGNLLLRVNPKEEVRAFQLKISGRSTPFGVDEEDLGEALDYLKSRRHVLPFKGIHVHAGSQCFSARGFSLHTQAVLDLANDVKNYGLPVSIINLGGGMGYGNWLPHRKADIVAFGNQLRYIRGQHGFEGEVRIEPGRFLVAPSGVYATPICTIKESRGTTFVILEGGVNHLFALSHIGYQTKQIWVEKQSFGEGESKKVQLVGPLCTPVDSFGGLVELKNPRVGDVLLFPCNGSYGLSMSPTGFLSHPLPQERFVDYE
ncbi:MAG: hypothetical protein CL916_09405 [Deltaproteobacteria bacterium]|nr:hypothetical protein [Deltaproteobacteria bacterium]